MRYLLALTVAFYLAGCASVPKEVRDDTRMVALYIQTVKKDAEDFKELRDLSTQARMTNIVALELKTLRTEQAIQRDLQEVEVTGDLERLKLLTAIQNASTLVLQQRQDYATKAKSAKADMENAQSAVSFQYSKLTEAAATLLRMAEGRSARDDAKFYVDFIKQVRTHVETDLKENTKQATGQSKAAATAKAKED
jgi:hypothetical protein